jgi:hypothetical protein
MSDESIFREVDEALRHDRFKALWDKYGVFVLLGAFLIVATVAGYNGWTYWQTKQASEAGDRFMGALQLEQDGKRQESIAAFQQLVDEGPRGYRLLSRFQVAAGFAKSGDLQGAVRAYDELAADGSLGQLMQGYAAIQAASLRVDEAGMDEMKERLGALANGQSSWRHSSRELLGLTAYRNGDTAEAERLFGQLLSDQAAPPNLRRRAEIMLALLVKSNPAAGGQ